MVLECKSSELSFKSINSALLIPVEYSNSMINRSLCSLKVPLLEIKSIAAPTSFVENGVLTFLEVFNVLWLASGLVSICFVF